MTENPKLYRTVWIEHEWITDTIEDGEHVQRNGCWYAPAMRVLVDGMPKWVTSDPEVLWLNDEGVYITWFKSRPKSDYESPLWQRIENGYRVSYDRPSIKDKAKKSELPLFWV